MSFRDIGEVCVCIPYRSAVFCIGVLHFLYSFFAMVSLMRVEDVRMQSGGYEPSAGTFQALIGSAGIFFGFLGMMGVVNHEEGKIAVFQNYLTVKILTLIGVFALDMRVLSQCEGWLDDYGNTKASNRPMWYIASQGLCQTARLSYIVGFTIDLIFSGYCIYVCYDYVRRMATNPSYTLKFAGDFRANHTHVKYYDPAVGEPGQYLFQDEERKSKDVYEDLYGAIP
eukprot:TRINITY_DN109145_c0_g1_i1.p1 TRINITY_DN109145_c0_g1~~TRINITY_DN109145_c0_g1_i1.p1  ORF type:complete len:226 (-),score=38.70 TRINITY_DN109145_c0_g1_i1:158-835(-)